MLRSEWEGKVESHKRTFLKMITWRIVAVLITFTVAYIATRKLNVAAVIGLSDALIKMPAYYFHERGWNKIKFGRTKPTKEDYQI